MPKPTPTPDEVKIYTAHRGTAVLGPNRRMVLDLPADFPLGAVEVLVLSKGEAGPTEPLAAPSLDTLLAGRPASLTLDHANACLPSYRTNPEWQAKHEAGTLPEGILGLAGCLQTVWPEERLSETEAHWVLAMREHLSWRALGEFVLGDGNQITGMDLEAAARRALEPLEQSPVPQTTT